VKETLSLPRQVERHPWAMMAGAAAMGFVGGWLSAPRRTMWTQSTSPAVAQASILRDGNTANGIHESQPNWLASVREAVAPEIEKLKSLAIGTVAGIARDVLADSVPDALKPRINEIADDLTRKLGAEPVGRSILHELIAKTEPSRSRDYRCR
jgi:hypothetical protein